MLSFQIDFTLISIVPTSTAAAAAAAAAAAGATTTKSRQSIKIELEFMELKVIAQRIATNDLISSARLACCYTLFPFEFFRFVFLFGLLSYLPIC